MSFKERRRARRISASLAVRVSGGPAAASGKTLNISANGVYFQTSRFIEPLTKVKLELLIPHPGASSDDTHVVGCDGIVVRVEPERQDPSVPQYNVAIFFTHLPKSSKAALEKYFKGRMTS